FSLHWSRDANAITAPSRYLYNIRFLCFYCACDHRDLHSFPTRRSSDLYANSLQVQWDFQPVRRLDARLAYKFYDTQTEYLSGQKELPFTAQHRGFFNLAYSTLRKVNGKQWSFDTTLQWVGEQRLPDTSYNPAEFQLGDYSNAYFMLNAQVSHHFNNTIRLYLGGENLLSYTQDNPIVDVQNPFGSYFDGGMVYAPVMPANFYIGLDIDF